MKDLKKYTSTKVCINDHCADVPQKTANILIGGAVVELLLHVLTK